MIWSFDASILMHVICLNMIIHTRALKSHPRREHTPMCVCMKLFVAFDLQKVEIRGVFRCCVPDWGEWMNEPAGSFSKKAGLAVAYNWDRKFVLFLFLLSHTCLTHHFCIQRNDQLIFRHRFYFCVFLWSLYSKYSSYQGKTLPFSRKSDLINQQLFKSAVWWSKRRLSVGVCVENKFSRADNSYFNLKLKVNVSLIYFKYYRQDWRWTRLLGNVINRYLYELFHLLQTAFFSHSSHFVRYNYS